MSIRKTARLDTLPLEIRIVPAAHSTLAAPLTTITATVISPSTVVNYSTSTTTGGGSYTTASDIDPIDNSGSSSGSGSGSGSSGSGSGGTVTNPPPPRPSGTSSLRYV